MIRLGTACLAILLLLITFGSATAEPKRILILHSFGRDFAPFADFSSLFRERLVSASHDPIDFYEASLDSTRYAGNQDDTPLLEYLRILSSSRTLDLIVTTGGPAARFIQRHRSELFQNTPVLFTAVERRNVVPETITRNDVVFSFSLDVNAIIAHILQLLPNTTNIAVVLGNSAFERFWLSEFQKEIEPFKNRINFIWLNELTLAETRNRVENLPPQSAVLLTLFILDGAGVPHAGNRVLEELVASANAPIFTFIDAYLGKGIVGGPLLSHDDLSSRSVEAALRVLNGESPANINAVTLGMAKPIYDHRQLRRWNIDEALLPQGSTVNFRETTVWERYRWQITATAAVLLAQALLIAILLAERSRRRRAEIESRGRLLEVFHLNSAATAGALSASISHELNQPLGAILSYSDAAELYLTASPPNLERALAILAEIRRDDQRAVDIMSRLKRLLRKREDITPDEFDLNDSVREALEIIGPEASKRGVLLVSEQFKAPLLVRADRVHVQQVILNLALNGLDAMKNCHSGPTNLTIRSEMIAEAAAEVSVCDTGEGVPNNDLETIFETFFTTKHDGTGLGLSIARTIVESYGGRIWAENSREGGAIFRFNLPLAAVASK
jgi:signal transduction histidine kinase